jgi:pyrroline-5-carboxylate reductase
MNIGFVGRGAITAAMVTGLSATNSEKRTIVLSPRSATDLIQTINAHLASFTAGAPLTDDVTLLILRCR